MKTQLLLTFTFMGMIVGSPLAQENSDDGYRIQSPIQVPSDIFSVPTVPPAPTVRPVDKLYNTPNQQQQQQQQATQQEIDQIPGFTRDAGSPAPSPSPSQMKGMPYEFEWSVNDVDNNLLYSHQESSDGAVAQGEYRVLLPDGRLQIVTFEDRGQGYQAQVTYQDYNV
ncbi:pro-resilin-like isoform X2 [Palaemon carinicauda]|uniref:pro-resilin-like isoform X2 n=1 Tax=Palaemon carinicauda TaxID=392227 RepID=UPI0035B59BCB